MLQIHRKAYTHELFYVASYSLLTGALGGHWGRLRDRGTEKEAVRGAIMDVARNMAGGPGYS